MISTSLGDLGMGSDTVQQTIDQLITSQSVMLATNQIMWVVAISFIVAAFAIWLAPKPMRHVDASAGGH